MCLVGGEAIDVVAIFALDAPVPKPAGSRLLLYKHYFSPFTKGMTLLHTSSRYWRDLCLVTPFLLRLLLRSHPGGKKGGGSV